MTTETQLAALRESVLTITREPKYGYVQDPQGNTVEKQSTPMTDAIMTIKDLEGKMSDLADQYDELLLDLFEKYNDAVSEEEYKKADYFWKEINLLIEGALAK